MGKSYPIPGASQGKTEKTERREGEEEERSGDKTGIASDEASDRGGATMEPA
jgi:hypothetical protein